VLRCVAVCCCDRILPRPLDLTCTYLISKIAVSLEHTATHSNLLYHNTLRHNAIHSRYNTLQHTAMHSNLLYHNTLRHNATHSRYNTLQHTATHCNLLYITPCDTMQHTSALLTSPVMFYQQHRHFTATHCNKLYCNTLQHAATMQHTPALLTSSVNVVSTKSPSHCNTLQHTATNCTATHCNTLPLS